MKLRNKLDHNIRINSVEKFSLRKLSVGLVAVILGTSFILFNNQSVFADEENQFEKQVENNSIDTHPIVEKLGIKQELSENNQRNNQNIVRNSLNNKTQSSTPLDKKTTTQVIPSQTSNSKNVNISTTNTSNMMAKNTSGHILIDAKNAGIYATGDQAAISISNLDNLLEFSNNAPSLGRDFSPATNGKGDFTFTYTGKTTSAFNNLKLDFSIIGNNDAVENYIAKYHQNPNNIPVNVNVTLPNLPAVNKTFLITLRPYADKIQTDELMHGFIIGPKVVWKPISSTNMREYNGHIQVQVGIDQNGQPVYVNKNQGRVENGLYLENGIAYSGPQLSALADLSHNEQNSARLMQYGIDWNFGGLDPLSNVLATINVNGGQIILPNTIKVFHVVNPNDIKTSNDIRVPISKSYNNIVKYDPTTDKFINEDSNFEKLLRDSLSKNKQNITINQIGPFTVNNINYSKKGAYFIQFDTKLNMNYLPNWQVKGNGPGISTPIHNERNWNVQGSGNNISTQIYTGFNLASIGEGSAVPETIIVK